jgi:hypothetical protein
MDKNEGILLVILIFEQISHVELIFKVMSNVFFLLKSRFIPFVLAWHCFRNSSSIIRNNKTFLIVVEVAQKGNLSN